MGIKVRKKDGKWYVFINYQKRRKAICVGDSKQAAEKVKRQLEARLVLGDVGILDTPAPRLTFGDYAAQWLDTYAAVMHKPSTQRIVQHILRNHLLPAFASHELQRITRAQVKAFMAEKYGQHYAPGYVRNLVRTLHSIYAQAIEDAVLTHNPAAQLGRLLPKARPAATPQHLCFTSVELGHYLATMHARYPQHYAYFLCLARTGMREGEALGLHWEDIQLGHDAQDPHRFVHVQRTYDPAHKVFNTPKTGKSRRVDMSQELRAAFLELQHQRFDAAVLQGRTDIPAVVFCGATGAPLSAAGLYKIHRRACAAAGLQGNRVHDLRHSYATIQLYEHHAPIQYVSEQLGHASIKMTVDTYGHPRQGTSIAFADRLDQRAPSAPDATSAQLDESSTPL